MSLQDFNATNQHAVRGGANLQRMRRNGFETFRGSFTYSVWEECWRNVLEERILSSDV